MTSHTNEFGQAIGFPLEFTGPWPRPQGITLPGCTCRLKRAAPEHARGLFDSFSHDHSGQNWTYMPTSPAPDFPSSRRGLCPHALEKTYFLH